MKTVMYKCDLCKKVIDFPKEQVWNVGIGIEAEPYHLCYFAKQVQWCRRCTESFRLAVFVRPKKEAENSPEPTLTFEDMVRAIVQEEIDQ